MKKYWSDMIRGVTPYTPGEQPRGRSYIKLNTNENPYPPSAKVLEAIASGTNESLRLYPDPLCSEFVEAVAEYHGVSKDMVFPGNGSDEILAFAFMAFFSRGSEIVFPDVTYSFYPVYAELFGINYREIPVDDDFSVRPEKLVCSSRGVVLANPNAPTGRSLPLSEVESIVKNNPQCVVIIDEAYVDFGGESAVGLTGRYDNLLVIHTLSKSRALAGMRIGYAVGCPGLIAGLNAVKNCFNSYTVNRLALLAGAAAMRDKEYFETTRTKIMTTRNRVSEALRRAGFKVIPSEANFIFISHPAIPAKQVFSALRERGILVRHFPNNERTENYLRVSIGSDGEMDKFLKQAAEIIGTKITDK
ncbi:MAG: histidinol-phosphate transaminase [Oscillospiraceae bacterium]|jgi:histidinol-phosphate aminotransferase